MSDCSKPVSVDLGRMWSFIVYGTSFMLISFVTAVSKSLVDTDDSLTRNTLIAFDLF